MADVVDLKDFFPREAQGIRPATLAMKPHVEACKAFLMIQTDDAWNALCHYVAQDIERRHAVLIQKQPNPES